MGTTDAEMQTEMFESPPSENQWSCSGSVDIAPIRFNGSDYKPERDNKRLTGQIERVYNVIKDGIPRTLSEISVSTGDPEASVSAQLRHLRKERFGGHVIKKSYVTNGVYFYRMEVNK